MNKKTSRKLLTKKQKKSTLKNLSIINGLLLIVQIILSSLFFVAMPATNIKAEQQMCSAAVDVVLVMDRSGSMGYTSKCDWWQLKCDNKPLCTSYSWVLNTTYDQTKSWCDAKTQSAPHQSVWTEYNPTKIAAAKEAANSFLDAMGNSDQSALVSFATTATLDKGLSNDHLLTKDAVNNLAVTGATNIGDAISFGFQELNSVRANPQAVKAMILLTDGKANKPNGSGSGENATDVAYAVSKAEEAANLNYKIFTVGLGSDGEINEDMLQQIADATGANYHHAPNGSDLSDIYNEIALQVCQYGSISGCVYNDLDNDASTNNIETSEPKLSGWEITLTNGTINQTQTLIDGCYAFSGLADGDYTISETVQTGWAQTYPAFGSYNITILDHNDLVDKDFANYLPMCGNDILDTGYSDYIDEQCEGTVEEEQTNEQTGYNEKRTCNLCSWTPWTEQENCGDGIINGNEQCDGQEGINEHQLCTASCTLEDIPWCGDLTINNDEECDGDAPRACEINNYTGTQTCDECTWNTCQPDQFCGDGAVNGSEICEVNETSSCQAVNGYQGTKTCSSACDIWSSCQPTESCGDTVKNGDEQCDNSDGVGEHQSCSPTCLLENIPYCGDGIKNDNEICDGTDGVTTGFHCTVSCVLEADSVNPICGNNQIENEEQCDDGNLVNGDGCGATCQTETNEKNNSISGFKYQDADGNLSTSNDQAILSGWIINLFQDATTTPSIAATTTDSLGQFVFANLLPGTYYLTETMALDWQQLNAPTTAIILSGNTHAENNNFINYYDNGGQGGEEPICGNGIKESKEACDNTDGVTSGYHCTASCLLEQDTPSGGGGGGGGTGPYCGDRVVNGTEQCETNIGAPAGFYCYDCRWQPITPSQPGTNATSTEQGTGGEIAGEETTGTGGGEEETGPLALGPVPSGSSAPINVPTETIPEQPGQIQGEQTAPVIICATCNYLDWLLILLILIVITLIYRAMLTGKNKENNSDAVSAAANTDINNNPNNNHQPKNKLFMAGGWLGIVILSALIYLIIKRSCHIIAPDWLIIFLLADFVVLLIVNYFVREQKHWWRLFGILLALLPLMAFLWCHPWAWWIWLITALAYFFIMMWIFTNWVSHRYAWVAAPVSLFLLLILYLISRCFC